MIDLTKVRTAVYRFHDRNDRLLYVGVAVDIVSRWRWHQSYSGWWPAQDRSSVQWYASRPTAEQQERLAIRNEDPIHNVNGSSRRRARLPGARKRQEIVDGLIDMIRAGELKRRGPIPSARELKIRYDCSITPVREAINHLKATGYVVGVPGVRVFVADHPPGADGSSDPVGAGSG